MNQSDEKGLLSSSKYKAYADEGLLLKSVFRNIISTVQSALDLYEKSKEWADLIKWLQRLSKVHLNHEKHLLHYQNINNNSKVLSKHTFSIIPHKLILSRRLAQCLNPTLPSGVHLKALETYALIFEKIKVCSYWLC